MNFGFVLALVLQLCVSMATAFQDEPSLKGNQGYQAWYQERHDEVQHSIPRPPWGLVENKIPFWEPFDSTIFHATHVALTPNAPEKSGGLWNTKMFYHDSWEMQALLGIGRYKSESNYNEAFKSDQGRMSIWYTTKFESPEKWVGLGIFFVNSPTSPTQGTIYAIMNNGEYSYTPDMYEWVAFASCRGVNFRIDDPEYEYSSRSPDKDPKGVHVRLTFTQGELAFAYYKPTDNFDIPNKPWTECFRQRIDNWPKKGFFGFTALTGPYHHDGDHHDILRVLVTSVSDTRENHDVFKHQGLIELGQGRHHKMLSEKLDELHEISSLDKTFDMNALEVESLHGLDEHSVFTKMTQELQAIERRQFEQLHKLTEKLKKMHEKMADVDEHINDGLTKTKESVMKLSEGAEKGKQNIEVIENDLSLLADATNRLTQRFRYIRHMIVSTTSKTGDSILANLIAQGAVKRDSSTMSYSLWIVFGLFQFFFLACFIYWRRSILRKQRF